MTLMSDPVAPSEDDAAIARKSSRQLAPLSAAEQPTIQLPGASPGEAPETIVLPRGAVQLLVQVLTEMSKGNAVTLMPIHAQLTTQQAADVLGVSRPFIVKEIREGRLAYQMIGTHRRIAYKDLMAYKRQCCERHNRAMDELTEQAQELGLGY